MEKADIQKLLGEEEWCVEGILDQGRYGVVVKAKEIITDVQYALKVVEYKSEEQIRYRKRELNLLAKNASQHKANVVQYYHAWTKGDINDKFLFIKMELCYRGLDAYMKEISCDRNRAGGSTGISIVKDANLYKFVFPQILNGLDAIHSLKPKWVHRDISLGNILVQYPTKSIQQIQVKIGDFGLAREVPTASGVHLSNQAKLDAIRQESECTLYQAPEMSGQNYCEKVDIYSSGIVLYLLSSYSENEDQWPSKDEIKALRDGKRDKSNLCHGDEVLAELLFSPTSSLLHDDAEKRPSAQQALLKLPLQRNIVDGDESTILLNSATKLLPEKFTVVDKSLGKGSYSIVISVEHRTDKKRYAVKIIRRTDVPEKYLKRELDILTKQVDSPIAHNNIVRYYDSWEEQVNGNVILYIQMELCDKSLGKILQETPAIVDDEVLHKHVFKQILRALQYIHSIDFVHRDVYPSNILISTTHDKIATWVVKLADFGLARKIDQSSQSNSYPLEGDLSFSVGNRYYRAPEMLKGSYGKKVDIYSAGVVLYRLCCCLENDVKIESCLSKLQKEKKVDRNILCVGGDRLYDLLNILVNENPSNRPDANQAEKMFLEYICPKSLLPAVQMLSLDVSADGKLDESDGNLQGPQPHLPQVDDTDEFSDIR